MKRFISLLLLFSLLVSNIGLVRIGDNCCSKTVLAVVQPILSSNCCCDDGQDQDDVCCNDLSVFSKLSFDSEKLDTAKTECKFKVDGTLLPTSLDAVKLKLVVENVAKLKVSIISGAPDIGELAFYKLYKKLILFG